MATKMTKRTRGWNQCKVLLAQSIRELKKTLNHAEKIPPKRRNELSRALKGMQRFAKFAASVGCSGSLMSFELKYEVDGSNVARTAARKPR
jgi:hypothetical protein